MINEKFGARLMSKKEVAQINEVLCKVLCHNICVVIQSTYELGIEPVSGVTRKRLPSVVLWYSNSRSRLKSRVR
jgi:hypothetical protein